MDSEVGILSSKKGSRTASVLNELLLLNKDQPSRWEMLADLRLAIGEQLLTALTAITSAREADAAAENKDIPIEKVLTPSTIEKLSSFLSDWDKHNVFGGPTLIHQLKRRLSASASSTHSQQQASTAISSRKQDLTTATADVTSVDSADPSDNNDDPMAPPSPAPSESEGKAASIAKVAPEMHEEQAEKELSELLPVAIAPSSSSASATNGAPSSPTETKSSTADRSQTTTAAAPSSSYDFESKNIPERIVDPRQLLEPCRAIATLQIARDLRNDNALQLSSLLQGMPEDVRAFTAELAERSENDGTVDASAIMDLDDTRARDFSNRTSDQLLDTDLGEALQNVRTLRDICRQQSAARQNLFDLLIASRCKFGADQVAAAFYAMDAEELKGRSQILADAMELEGLDIAEMEGDATGGGTKAGNKTTNENLDEELPLLTWYKPEDAADATKRIKVE